MAEAVVRLADVVQTSLVKLGMREKNEFADSIKKGGDNLNCEGVPGSGSKWIIPIMLHFLENNNLKFFIEFLIIKLFL